MARKKKDCINLESIESLESYIYSKDYKEIVKLDLKSLTELIDSLPYSRSMNIWLEDILEWLIDNEYYECCVIIRDEINRRVDLYREIGFVF